MDYASSKARLGEMRHLPESGRGKLYFGGRVKFFLDQSIDIDEVIQFS